MPIQTCHLIDQSIMRPSLSDLHAIPLLSDSQDDEGQQRLATSRPRYRPHEPSKRSLVNRYSWIVAGILLIIFIGLLLVPKPSNIPATIDDDLDDEFPVPDSAGICKQSEPRELPNDNIQKALEKALRSDDYRQGSVQRLSGAVQIPTESFDDMGPVYEDPRWQIFQRFHDYLAQTYPEVYHLSVHSSNE
jgi:hypothetical protein